MLTAFITTLLVVVGLAYSTRNGRGGEIINRRPYNNRYSDASAAREDHLG